MRSMFTASALALVFAGAAAAAPAPKVDPHARQGAAYGAAVAKLPDWNGTWQFTGGFVFDPDHAVGAHDGKPGTDFGSPGGTYMTGIPYKPEWRTEYMRRVEETRQGRAHDEVANCRPEGIPRNLGSTPGPIEIVVMPKITFMSWQWFDQTRRIYTDGREHPPRDVAYERDLGHSIGHWEGDTLVIDTVDMRAGNFDMTEAPYSPKLHMVERWHMTDDGALQDDITLDDPVMMTAPWKVTRKFVRMPLERTDPTRPGPDWVDVESIFCTNNRNATDASGVQTVQLPGDRPAAAAPAATVHSGQGF